MEFSIKSGSPDKQRSACVVVGVYEPRKLMLAGEQIDRVSNGYLSDIIRRGATWKARRDPLLLQNVPHPVQPGAAGGTGARAGLQDRNINSLRAAIKTLNDTGSLDAVLYLTELAVKRRDTSWKIFQAVIVAMESVYRFDRLKSKQNEVRRPLRKLTLCVSRHAELPAGEEAMRQGLAVAHGMNFTKDMGNLPSNLCTPSYLAEQALGMAKTYGLKATVLEQKDMEKLGMGALLSVTRASREPAKLITLEYHGADRKHKPIVLVGKGITFDTGGISLKPAAEMDEMKFDMCGAASVLGTVKAVAQMQLAVNVVGIVPTCENMPGGNASKPGDVVTSMSGQTIEVLNTDAEGRLILCDALTYAERFEPDTVVDVATLTVDCVIALGHVATGLFSNDDALARELLHAADYAFDRAWHLPLWDDYQEQLKSNFADMANIGGRPAGSVTAACFLSRFAKKYRWAHLDIAGTAWKSGREKGATGRPVPLLSQFLIGRAGGKTKPKGGREK